MFLKHVLAPMLSAEGDEPGLALSHAIAEQFGAQVAVLIVAVNPASVFADEGVPLSDVLLDIVRGSQGKTAQERAQILDRLADFSFPFEIRDITIDAAVLGDEIIAHARCSDLTVLTRTKVQSIAHRAILQDILFGSGRPVLLVPNGWRSEKKFDRILIGWNARREAVRATNDALPFLKAASEVVIATVDASPRPGGHGEAPGRELAAHLARHGVATDVRNIDGLGRTEGKALVDEAVAIDAGMIVIGAYGHSRAAQFLFGGVTRELLASSPVPVFLSH